MKVDRMQWAVINRMLNWAALTARRGPHGQWVLTLDERHDDDDTSKEFLDELAAAAGLTRNLDMIVRHYAPVDPNDEDVQ